MSSSNELNEEMKKLRKKIDNYVTSALFFVSIVVTSILIPFLPVGGFYILPILLGLILAILNYRGFLTISKYIMLYYVIATLLLQVFVSFYSLELYNSVDKSYIISELAFVLVGIVLLPIFLKPVNGFSIAVGWLATALLVYPKTFAIGIALIIIASLYQQLLTKSSLAVPLIVAILYQPFLIAATLANVSGISNAYVFPLISIKYVSPNVSPSNMSVLLMPTNNVTDQDALKNPIYLLAPLNDVSGYNFLMPVFLNYYISTAKSFSSPISLIKSIWLLISSDYIAQLFIIIVFSITSFLAAEGMNILNRYFLSPDRGKIAKWFNYLQPAIFALLLSVLFVYIVSQSSIPLNYTTSFKFTYTILLGTFGSVIIGGIMLSAEEIYISRKANEVIIRGRIREKLKDFESIKKKFIDEIQKVSSIVRDKKFYYDEPLNNIEKEVKVITKDIDKMNLENLHKTYKLMENTIEYVNNLELKFINEVIEHARNSSLKYNFMAEEMSQILGVKFEALPTIFSSLEEAINYFEIAYEHYESFSKTLVHVYTNVVNAMFRLFPEDTPNPEQLNSSYLLSDIENLINYYLKPIISGESTLFENFRDKICEKINIGCKYTIVNVDKFLEEILKWTEAQIKELESYKNMISSLRNTISEIVMIEQSYAILQEEEKIVPDIEVQINRLKEWSNAQSFLEAIEEQAKLLPRIKDAIEKDKVQIVTLSIYRLVERYIEDLIKVKEYIEPNDVPLEPQAATLAMKYMAMLNPDKYGIETKELPFGGQVIRLIRRIVK
jgi:tetratricopeptide (TPR) repeat protein